MECKADNVTITQATYTQGGNYANFCKALFFATHNNRQTKFWRVDHSKLAPNYTEIKDIPHAGASDKEIKEILASLRTFREDEFADLLHQCNARTAVGMWKIGAEDIRNFPLPLPPFEVQRKIADAVAEKRAEIAHIRLNAYKKAEEIKKDIEALILGTKKLEGLDMANDESKSPGQTLNCHLATI